MSPGQRSFYFFLFSEFFLSFEDLVGEVDQYADAQTGGAHICLVAGRVARAGGASAALVRQAERVGYLGEGCRRRRQVWLSGAEPDEQRNSTLERVKRVVGRT